MFRKILIVAAVLVVGAAAPASAQYDSLVVNPGQVIAGGAVSVSGFICDESPDSDVVISLRPAGSSGNGIQVATAPSGPFNVSFNVPADTAPGTYEVVAECGGNTKVKTIEVLGTDVTPPTTPPTTPGQGTDGTGTGTGTGDLPRTGSDLNGYGLVGAGLLTVGGLFLLGARKRRSSATA